MSRHRTNWEPVCTVTIFGAGSEQAPAGREIPTLVLQLVNSDAARVLQRPSVSPFQISSVLKGRPTTI